MWLKEAMLEIQNKITPACKEGDRLCGYEVKRVARLIDIDAIFYELEHLTTKSRHIHIQMLDNENTFSVALKTVPEDSTGVAHILEHTVLCGSNKYPIRDPFFSMLKRSLSTFMNAFTSSDWTMYPFCTQNRKDFFNLMSVYLDAVFYPKLDRLNFKQEGHRLEIDGNATVDGEDTLVYKGIVYNEMKGAMSSPSQVMTRSLFEALYPDTTYHFNSGGDPKHIPKLTLDGLKSFHGRYYHPSNAFFYTYGDIDLRETLSFINESVLNHFSRIDPKTEVSSQERWRHPKTLSYTYPFAKDEDPEKKSQVSVAWLTADVKDHFDVIVLTLLEQILLGNAASPMRKALIDSGIGSALSDGTGYIADNRDTMFSFGLKDVSASEADRIEEIVLDVLKQLVKDGIDRALIDSAIHQLEFYRKEITNRPYPYGLKLLLSFSGSWFHGGDPLTILNFSADIEEIQKAVASGSFFEEKIKVYFLNNPHRVRLTLLPDQEMGDKEDRRVRSALSELRAGLGEIEINEIQKDTEALKQLQEKEEDLSSLPTLEIEDIPPSIKIVQETGTYGSDVAAYYEQATSGIFYFTAAIGAGGVEQDLLPYVPFFSHAFTKVGTALHDYTEVVRIIDAYTGGMGMSTHARTPFGSSAACLPIITFNGKCLTRNQDRMFEIIQELIGHMDFSDITRLKNLLLEYRAGIESMVVPNGHRLAMLLAARGFTSASALDEIWHGIHQLRFIKSITDDLTDSRLKQLSERLSAIGRAVLNRSNFKMALIGEAESLGQATPSAARLYEGLDDSKPHGFNEPEIDMEADFPREGWSTATSVSYVARVFQTVRMDHDDAPALSVIAKMLRSMYLHREIREKGGAYGGFSIYSPEDGLFYFASYRDPHICNTLNVYDAAFDFVKSDAIKEQDVKEAVLQVCSEIERPDPPGPEARKAFYRKIIGLTNDARKRFKHNVLTMTLEQVREVAEKYFDAEDPNYSMAVISSEEKIKAASKTYPLTLHKI